MLEDVQNRLNEVAIGSPPTNDNNVPLDAGDDFLLDNDANPIDDPSVNNNPFESDCDSMLEDMQIRLNEVAIGSPPTNGNNVPLDAGDDLLSDDDYFAADVATAMANSLQDVSERTWTSVQGTPPAPGVVGIINLGNTCYLSSILQCLLPVVELRDYLRDYLREPPPQSSSSTITAALANVFNLAYSNNYTKLAPTAMMGALRDLGTEFSVSRQCDSQELLMFLLDRCHEDCRRGSGGSGSVGSVRNYFSSSVIASTFGGTTRSTKKCGNCSDLSSKVETFTMLSLEIPNETERRKRVELLDCFGAFSRVEQLEDVVCEMCGVRTGARKTLKLIGTQPKVLIVQMKRFKNVGKGTTKINTLVNFPVGERLEVTTDDGVVVKYELLAVNYHEGNSESGHYVSAVKWEGEGGEGGWRLFDDLGDETGMKDINEDRIVTAGAYILFYRKVEAPAARGAGGKSEGTSKKKKGKEKKKNSSSPSSSDSSDEGEKKKKKKKELEEMGAAARRGRRRS